MFRIFRIAAVVFAGIVLLSPISALGRPNVIVIMGDDLGYETIGANGGTSYRTPTLDGLAKGGVRFTHCYVQPLCTPTRVQLMTGRYNVRNYIDFGNMDPQAVTFGNLFQKAGYATCMVGKWQLGRDVGLPKKFGFDEYCLWQHTRRPPRYVNPGLEYNGVEKDFTKGEYGPDLVNEYALDFVARNKEKPFFLYYAMMLTHGPYMATPDSKDWDPKEMGESGSKDPQHFADMVEYMDKLLGKLMAGLDKAGVRENTLVLFLGDNGTGAGTRSMMGSREVIGGKGSTTEFGMHVPLIASWPGKIASGKVSSDLVDSTDFLPTICEAAGVTFPADLKIDGRSFFPQLNGEMGKPREWVYSWYSPRGEALREFAFDQRYKLYRNGDFFDLQSDRAEQKPVKASSLSGEPLAAAKKFEQALAQYRDARPAHLPKPAEEDLGSKAGKAGKKAAKKAGKNKAGG
jgi:arylsulfatase A